MAAMRSLPTVAAFLLLFSARAVFGWRSLLAVNPESSCPATTCNATCCSGSYKCLKNDPCPDPDPSIFPPPPACRANCCLLGKTPCRSQCADAPELCDPALGTVCPPGKSPSPGGGPSPCCPVGTQLCGSKCASSEACCGGIFPQDFFVCKRGTFCSYDTKNELYGCCPAGTKPCNRKCVPRNETCCLDQSDCFERPERAPADGQSCVGSLCSGGCPLGYKSCYGKCISSSNSCCRISNVICPPGEACNVLGTLETGLDAKCCPLGQAYRGARCVADATLVAKVDCYADPGTERSVSCGRGTYCSENEIDRTFSCCPPGQKSCGVGNCIDAKLECCGKKQTCGRGTYCARNARGSVCCALGQQNCGGKCVSGDVECCDPERVGGRTCPKGSACLGKGGPCCKVGEFLCGGKCVPKSATCCGGTVACLEGTYCNAKYRQCCRVGTERACFGKCIPATQTCCGGRGSPFGCPAGKYCAGGSLCCTFGFKACKGACLKGGVRC